MKKILLSFLIFAVAGYGAKLQAQCTVSNLAIEVINFNTTTCQVTFNVSFDQEINSGNKFAYVHLWTSSAYHTPASAWPTSGSGQIYNSPSNYPTATELVNALGTISIQFNGTATPSIMATYLPDPTVTTLTAGLSIVKTPIIAGVSERETISGVSLTLSGCSGVVTLKGDIWASQAANGKNVHCAVQGLAFNINNPQITSALKICDPRSLTFGIINNGSSPLTEHFLIYRDNGNGIFEPATGFDGPAIITGTDTTLAPTGVQSRFQLAFPGYNTPGENSSFWLEVVVPSTTFTTVAFMANPSGCLPLPVDFKSFTAVRNNSNVSLKWETTTEQNNTGFAVERLIGSNDWQQIAFVPTQAPGGNSSSLLSYQYIDLNSTKGMSQYRIKQIDIDARAKYSVIRAVRGEGQLGKTIVFPNPSNDGSVKIVFEDANATRDISVMDMSGRMIKQMKGITNNNIQIDNLTPGMYSLRVVVRETGDQVVEKIVVNKR